MEKTDLAVNDDPAVVFGAVPRGFLHCVELRQRRHPHLPFFLAASVNQAQTETDSWIGYQIFSPPVSLLLFSLGGESSLGFTSPTKERPNSLVAWAGGYPNNYCPNLNECFFFS